MFLLAVDLAPLRLHRNPKMALSDENWSLTAN